MIQYISLPDSVKDLIDSLPPESLLIPIVDGEKTKAFIIHPDEYQRLVSSSSSEQQLASLEDAYINFLIIVASAMDSHEAYFAGHTGRVTMLASALAEQLNLSSAFIQDIRLAALLHDIGEVVIPNDILNKVGKLTQDEYEVLRQHPTIGSQIVATVSRLERVAEIIHDHHEKYDGTGYPNGIKGEEIPLGARILSIVDAYDAMTNLRTNRENIDHDQAMLELQRNNATAFEPYLLQEFEKIF